jgi:hypothetical protein
MPGSRIGMRDLQKRNILLFQVPTSNADTEKYYVARC